MVHDVVRLSSPCFFAGGAVSFSVIGDVEKAVAGSAILEGEKSASESLCGDSFCCGVSSGR